MYLRFCYQHFEGLLYISMNIFFFVKEIQTKDLHFTKTDCEEYRHYLRESNDVYQVVWDGEPYPDFCSLRFSNGYAGLDNEWHICAEITYLKLECGKSEVAYYYAGDIQRFTCNDRLPIERYCDNSIIYVKLLHYVDGSSERTNSRLRIKVTRVFMEKDRSDSDSGTTLAAVLPLSIGMVVVMITIIVCLYLRRQRLMREQAQDTGGVVVLGRRGNMVMMGVPANRANDMMVHAANQYGENQRPNRPYPSTEEYPQQQQEMYPASNQQNFSQINPVQQHVSNPPPSYNDVFMTKT